MPRPYAVLVWLVGAWLLVAGPAKAQLGPVSSPLFFRIYSPEGQLVTPATRKYAVFVQDTAYHTGLVAFNVVCSQYSALHVAEHPRSGGWIIPVLGLPGTYEAGSSWQRLSLHFFEQATNWYTVHPPKGWRGSEWSAGFHLVVAHGRDTMRVYTPPLPYEPMVLDSLVFRPGNYHLTKQAYRDENRRWQARYLAHLPPMAKTR